LTTSSMLARSVVGVALLATCHTVVDVADLLPMCRRAGEGGETSRAAAGGVTGETGELTINEAGGVVGQAASRRQRG
ncbi:hypothetical protein ACLOJK_029597, partial [Asimina triloba]